MSFVAPLFLFGAIAIALPFWLHRLQTQSSDRKPFSSAMLLETTDQQVHVQKKLKYFVLLALRVALLALIVLAFAKPVWTNPDALPGPGPDGTHLVLVDTSASMRRNGVFEQAIERSLSAVSLAPDGAMLQVLSAGADVRATTELTTDDSVALAALRGVQPDAARLDLGEMMATVDRLGDSLPAPITLHVISDFQDSGLPARFSDLVSSRIASLQIGQIAAAPGNNWSLEAIRDTAEGIDVVVTAAGDPSMATTITARVNGIVAGREELTGPGTRTLSFANLELEDGDNRVHVTVESNDILDIDNNRYHVIRNEPPAPIPLLTLNSGGLPVTYLSAALHADPHSNYRVEPAIIGDFDDRTLSRYRWLIIDDIGSVGAELEAALDEFVRNGGNILAFAGQRSAIATRLPLLGNAISGASIGAGDDRFLSIGQVDTRHPLLASTDGWYAVNFSQTIPVIAQLEDQVLIRLENDEPFVLERQLGQGRVLLVSGGLENRWNDLPTRPVFVSFVIEAASYLSGSEQVVRSFPAGSVLPLSLVGGSSGQVVDPQGRTVLSLADTTSAQQIQLDQTGFYEVYTSQGSYIVAVNVDPRELRFGTMPPETLQRWTAAMSGPQDAAAALDIEQEAEPLELWPALLFILALVLIAESLIGNWHLAPRTSGGSN
jgi:hypothetical protein